jgi:hypothetical protein
MEDDPKPSEPSETAVVPREPPPDAGAYFTKSDPRPLETRTTRKE